MKTIMKNNKRTKAKLEKMSKMYIVGQWAHYGTMEFYFSGKYENVNGVNIPLVWQYDDFNGTCDNWYLRKITSTTTGMIFFWTHSRGIAEYIATNLEKVVTSSIECAKKVEEAKKISAAESMYITAGDFCNSVIDAFYGVLTAEDYLQVIQIIKEIAKERYGVEWVSSQPS